MTSPTLLCTTSFWKDSLWPPFDISYNWLNCIMTSRRLSSDLLIASLILRYTNGFWKDNPWPPCDISFKSLNCIMTSGKIFSDFLMTSPILLYGVVVASARKASDLFFDIYYKSLNCIMTSGRIFSDLHLTSLTTSLFLSPSKSNSNSEKNRTV